MAAIWAVRAATALPLEVSSPYAVEAAAQNGPPSTAVLLRSCGPVAVAPRWEGELAALVRPTAALFELSVEELLSRTHQWQVVRAPDSEMAHHKSVFETTSIDDYMQDTHGLAFRTSGKVLDPKRAYGEVLKYFDLEPAPQFMEGLRKAAHVTVPASWVKQYHLHKDKQGAWAESFIPADHQARLLKEGGNQNEERRQR
jgi:hypothetical protein